MASMRKVASLSDIPHDRGLGVESGGTKILLVRDGDSVRAYGGECPHAGAPLDEGAVCNGRIICPWHKGEFLIETGALAEPPALAPLQRYDVRLDGNDVYVGDEMPQDEPQMQIGAGVTLIAGAGAAGAAAIATLREAGYAGRIVLAGEDEPQPYDRTSLSKFVLSGEMKPDDVPPLLPDDFFTRHNIERVETTIAELDVEQRRAVFADGKTLEFDTALIATGSAPIRLDIPGADLPGVHVLRSRQDVSAIVAGLRPGARAVILGTSFIGLEAASGLRQQKLDVTIVGPDHVPFTRQFGDEIGSAIRALHETNGVIFHTGTRAARLLGDNAVTDVLLEDGATLPADIVLVAVGVKPTTDFVQGVPRDKDGALTVDAAMRVAGPVFAAGDVALFPLPLGGEHARIEHWRVAQQQARVAATNMAGGDAVYDGVPFFWTYHYGKNIEYLGHAQEWDDIVMHGDPRQQDFIALLCNQGKVSAVVACGRERETALLIEHMRNTLTAEAALAILSGAQAQQSAAA